MSKNIAKLVNCIPMPMETAYWAFQNMHNKVGYEVQPFKSHEEKIDFLTVLSKIPHTGVLEFIKPVWYIDGSRAFQQQLTRTRQAVFSIQSLRIVNVDEFADTDYYHTPPMMSPDALSYYHETMYMIQERYRGLLDRGAPVEAARGVLPLNIMSPITTAIDLRSLVHTMELRMCKNAQGEYRDVAAMIYKEVEEKIDADFARLFFKAPCQKFGFCTSPVPCDMVPSKYKCAIDIDVAKIGIRG